MKKRLTALLLSLCLVLSLMPFSASAASKPGVKTGDYIQMGKYNGKSILWRCVGVDDNGPLMLADKIIDTLSYDAKTNDNSKTKSHSRNYKRDNYGSNYWKDSNLRSWLNSTASAGNVEWLCGNPPKDGYVGNGGAYNNKAGFLNSFSKAEIAAMKTVTQRSIVSHPEYNRGFVDGIGTDLPYHTSIQSAAYGFENAHYQNTTEKVFLLDVKQVNTVYNNLGNYYIATNNDGVTWPYWLRTPVTDCNHDIRYVNAYGEVGRYAPWYSHLGVRPAFYLDSDYFVAISGSGTEGNPYVGSAPDKQESDYSVSEPEEEESKDWDVGTSQSITLNLGDWYTDDERYSNPTIPVYTIQKPRSDNENMVIVVCGEGYTKSQQGKFISDVKRLWSETLKSEPYRSMADRFNVYALCTASETEVGGNSTFFDMSFGSYGRDLVISNVKSPLKNHILDRCIAPEFIDKIHDAHIKNTTNPNEIYFDSNGNRDEQAPYRYVYDYITEFFMLVNSAAYGGASISNKNVGIRYVSASSDNASSIKTLIHEFGHGLLGLTEEYSTGSLAEGNDIEPNVAWTGDPTKVKWKKLLGFRTTYSTRNEHNQSDPQAMVGPSWECVMRSNINLDCYCEICKLHGVKVLSKLYTNPPELYVATPEVKRYTGQYKNPSEEPDAYSGTSFNDYWDYAADRINRLLSGAYKSNFTSDMAGQEVELRTIVQNLTDTKANKVTLKMWVRHSDGTVAVTSSGKPVEATQTYDIPLWDKKADFYSTASVNYDAIDFDSGLVNCSLVYKIPNDAVLKSGDTIAFTVTDTDGNVLATDNTETQAYANVNVEYRFADGTEIPNTDLSTMPIAVGTKLDWEAPESFYGYDLIKTEGLDKAVPADGMTVTYYYGDSSELTVPEISTVSLSLESSITMNFKVLKNSLSSFDDFYMTFEFGDKNATVTDYTQQGSYYVFSYTGISPQLMNDDVVAVLHTKSGGKEYSSPERVMSVKTYAYRLLERYGNDDNYSKLRTLLVDLLNYGAAAQQYIGYQANNLVNAELTATQKSWASKESVEFNNIRDFNYKTVSSPKSQWKSSGLILNNSVMIKAKFTADSIENKTVEITSKNAKFTYTKDDFVKNADGTYYVYCNELYANEMSDELYFTVYENGVPCSNTMRFSIESYARLVRDSYKGEPLDKMITAMMLYGNSAKAYGA